MVPPQVVEQIGLGVPDPVADDPRETDLAGQPEVTQLPGVEAEKLGSLFFGESQFAVNQEVHAGEFVEYGPDDLLHHGPELIPTQSKVSHDATHVRVVMRPRRSRPDNRGCVSVSVKATNDDDGGRSMPLEDVALPRSCENEGESLGILGNATRSLTLGTRSRADPQSKANWYWYKRGAESDSNYRVIASCQEAKPCFRINRYPATRTEALGFASSTRYTP